MPAGFPRMLRFGRYTAKTKWRKVFQDNGDVEGVLIDAKQMVGGAVVRLERAGKAPVPAALETQ